MCHDLWRRVHARPTQRHLFLAVAQIKLSEIVAHHQPHKFLQFSYVNHRSIPVIAGQSM
jgi:hypothetical protein